MDGLEPSINLPAGGHPGTDLLPTSDPLTTIDSDAEMPEASIKILVASKLWTMGTYCFINCLIFHV